MWVPAAVVLLALPNAPQKRRSWKLFGLGLAIMAFRYGALWNVNYLLARFVPATLFHDPELRSFDVWFYSLIAGKTVGYTGLFPLVHSTVLIHLLENSYLVLFSEVVLVLLIKVQSEGADEASLFLIRLFSLYAIGAACFLIYPAIGPCLYYPESTDATRALSSTLALTSGMLNDYRAAVSGGALKGYGYFIAVPSLHVLATLFLQVCLLRYRTLSIIFLPINIMVILSTFFLGYHYLLDIVIAVIILGIAIAWTRRTQTKRLA